jgi:hypothetical protein
MAAVGPSTGLASSRATMPHPPPDFGLCAHCKHQKLIKSGRGSQFSMCRLGLKDPNWPKYPRMPVSDCTRFAPGVGQPEV